MPPVLYARDLRSSYGDTAALRGAAATMLLTSVVGVAVGLLLVCNASRQSNMDWRRPGLDLLAFIGSGVIAAPAFSTLALPLLDRTTRHDAVRFE